MSPIRSQSVSVLPVSIPPPPAPLVRPAAPPAAVIQNDKLKELMASLNPAALQGVLGPGTPSSASTTPVPASAPFLSNAYQAFPLPPPGYNSPYRPPAVPAPTGRSSAAPMFPGRESPLQQQGPWVSRRRDERSRSPDRSRGYGRGGPGRPRESDNGWGSRGRGSGERY